MKSNSKKPAKQEPRQPNSSGFKRFMKKLWHFIWEDESILSWIVNIILAFILIKFLVYPGLGLVLQTSNPVVAVVSSSMEHNAGFNAWIEQNSGFYAKYSIYKDIFEDFPFRNGFNKGDIMVLYSKDPTKIKIGDIIVFKSGMSYPIIHRVIEKWQENGAYYFHTKGDNNPDSIVRYINISSNEVLNPASKNAPGAVEVLDETSISENQLIGKAVLRIPYLGWIKIGAVSIFQSLVDITKAII